MIVLTNKILFLILLKFILKNNVLNQTLTVEPPRPNNEKYSVQSELSKNLKKRLSNFGSLASHKSEENSSPKPKSEDSFLETSTTPRQAPTRSPDPTLNNKFFQGAYQPTPKSDFSTTNFEEFLTKQKKEYLERCTKVPHDFVLVVDESGSISSYNWGTVVKDFVNLVTTAIALINGENNFSIVQYSNKPKMVMEPTKLNKSTLDSASKVVKHMFEAKRTYGTTHTGEALEFVRERILDPTNKFVLELAEGATPLDKKNMIVILLTDGASNDHDKALRESLVQRFNGVELFIFGIGSVSESECRKFVGCPSTGECTNFLHAEWNTVLDYLFKLIASICRSSGKNATCLETWSKFGECSVPCGGGTRKSYLQKITTLTEPTVGLDGRRGMTCEEQYRNITERTEVCNMFPCRDYLVNINEHTPTSESVSDRLVDFVYGKRNDEPSKPDRTRQYRRVNSVVKDRNKRNDLGGDQDGTNTTNVTQRDNKPMPQPEVKEEEPDEEEQEEPEEQELEEREEPPTEETSRFNHRTVETPEPEKPDLTDNTSQLTKALKTLENAGNTDKDLTQNTVTTEPEVKERTTPRLERLYTEERPSDPVERLNTETHVGDALRELVDHGPEMGRAPFQLVGGPEHQNFHVDHVLSDEEVEEMRKRKNGQTSREPISHPTRREFTHTSREREREPLLKSKRSTETRSELEPRLTDSETQTFREEPRNKVDTSTETDSEPELRLTDSETQTYREEPRNKVDTSTETDRELESRPIESRDYSTQTHQEESVQKHNQYTNTARKGKHVIPTHNQNHHTRHTQEEHPTLPTKTFENVGTLTKNIKQKFRNFFHNEKVRKLCSVAIVIFLTAISISVFSYIFLRDKEPTPHLFDPSDQEFMNAGDGDDVEPSENYQVSNMEDDIWA